MILDFSKVRHYKQISTMWLCKGVWFKIVYEYLDLVIPLNINNLYFDLGQITRVGSKLENNKVLILLKDLEWQYFYNTMFVPP